MTMTDDPTATYLTNEVAEARQALLARCETDPERWWSSYRLKLDVRNGWSPGAMSLALNRLLEEGQLESQKGRVRLAH